MRVPRHKAVDGWYSRGYLPHFDDGETAQHVDFRLFDSIPLPLLREWEGESERNPHPYAEAERRKKIDHYLDRGEGSAWLKIPAIAKVVEDALLAFDGDRYQLTAWVVMPNHVHALLTQDGEYNLGEILHSWKSFTAHECNKLLGRSGSFWMKECFDRYIRNDEHFWNTVAYIENNPVKAKLCDRAEQWSWSSARRRMAEKC